MKKIVSISIIMIIGIWLIVLFGLSSKITADIPSTSAFVPNFKDWNVYFSEPMNPDTFTEETVTIKNEKGNLVQVEMNWNNDFTVLTIQAPELGYEINESYQITISSKVENSKGEKLAKKITHEFTAVAALPKIENEEQLVQLLKERIDANKGANMHYYSDFDESAEAQDSAANDSASGSNESSGTNVQVQGINEADIIKTDGKSIFFVRDGDIIISSAQEEQSTVLSQIKKDNFYPQEIYLYNDLLITIGLTSVPLREMEKSEAKADIWLPGPIYHNQTTILIYDINDPSKPNEIREVSQEGYYHTSRMLDGYLYIIANELPPYHILRTTETEDVRPFIKDSAVSDESMPVDFENMYFFPDSKEDSFLIFTSIDLDDMEKEAHMETYLGASEQIYMSHDNLYVALNHYQEVEEDSSKTSDASDSMIWLPREADTEITQFRINEGTLTYNASTLVNGTLINQFAMDERNNTFRVATTKGNSWNADKPSTNNLYTFDLNLQPLGAVEGLAEGERIYSVRFMDDVAYMVTFKQIDPLFVIDLKDPNNPTVLGELKIPGFSNYLHPLDDNHVIGFGQNTRLIQEKGMREPIVRMDGIKISVFDVSDPTNPIEKYSEVIGQDGSYSELLHNHKALFKHPTENIFGFPAVLSEIKMVRKGDITWEEYSVIYEGALLYEITPAGINLVDTITHQREFKDYPDWVSEIRRMVSVDDVLYTFSWNKMKVYDMKQKEILKTVELPELSIGYY